MTTELELRERADVVRRAGRRTCVRGGALVALAVALAIVGVVFDMASRGWPPELTLIAIIGAVASGGTQLVLGTKQLREAARIDRSLELPRARVVD